MLESHQTWDIGPSIPTTSAAAAASSKMSAAGTRGVSDWQSTLRRTSPGCCSSCSCLCNDLKLLVPRACTKTQGSNFLHGSPTCPRRGTGRGSPSSCRRHDSRTGQRACPATLAPRCAHWFAGSPLGRPQTIPKPYRAFCPEPRETPTHSPQTINQPLQPYIHRTPQAPVTQVPRPHHPQTA